MEFPRDEATPPPLKDYKAISHRVPLRRDVYEAKFDDNTSDIAFIVYDMITQWRPSWPGLYSYIRLHKTALIFHTEKTALKFVNLPENIQRTILGIIHKCSSTSLYQLISIFERMVSVNFIGTTEMLLDIRELLIIRPQDIVKFGYMSHELYDTFNHYCSSHGTLNHNLVPLVGAARLFGENNLIELLTYAGSQHINYQELDMVKLLSNWEEMRDYPLEWIISIDS